MLIPGVDFILGGGVAIAAGLDRTAALQLMISRPIIAGPLTGLILGDWLVGLQVGMLLELLWLGRLPVGAAIPPDDTQVAVGSTVLAIAVADSAGDGSLAFLILCILVAMPLGKIGQLFDRQARSCNGRLPGRVEAALDGSGTLAGIEFWHLSGLVSFAVASLATYLVIVAGGALLLRYLAPFLLPTLEPAAGWLKIIFPLVGTAAILGRINVNRSMTLFGAAYAMALLLLWLA